MRHSDSDLFHLIADEDFESLNLSWRSCGISLVVKLLFSKQLSPVQFRHPVPFEFLCTDSVRKAALNRAAQKSEKLNDILKANLKL